MKPELVREVLSKSIVFQKLPGRPFVRLMSKGLVTLETDRWAKHRRLINPAFHVNKLEVGSFNFMMNIRYYIVEYIRSPSYPFRYKQTAYGSIVLLEL